MTLGQIKAYRSAIHGVELEQARLALFVARAAQADEDGYKNAVKLLGG